MVRKIKAKLVLQLRNQNLSRRAIESAHKISRHSIQAVLDAAELAGLGWDDVAEMSEAEVYAALFPGRGVRESVFAQPDWARVHTELARVGVTLKLLHQEYVDTTSRAGQAVMSYDRFCRLYGEHAAVTGASSRVGHKAGRSIEVDWSGPTMQLLDPTTGEISKVYLFVACLPFSRYAFVEATLDMKQDSCVRGSEPGYAAGVVATRPHIDVYLLRRQRPAPGARQPEDRSDLPPSRGRGRSQRCVPRNRGALFGRRIAGQSSGAEGLCRGIRYPEFPPASLRATGFPAPILGITIRDYADSPLFLFHIEVRQK